MLTLIRNAGRWLTVLTALVVLLLGCSNTSTLPGSVDSQGQGTEEPVSEPTGSAEADPAPRTVQHKYGNTEITGVPQRVVTLGLTDQDYVVALGVGPVGTSEWFGQQPGALYPWARAALGDLPMPETVLDVYELQFEAVAALEPDLILASNSGLTQDEYTTLSEIAPTVAQPADFPDFGAPWQEITRRTGLALGRTGQAEALVPRIEAMFEQFRRDNPELGNATGMIAAKIGEEYYIYPEGPAPTFLRDLGIQIPPDAEQVMDDNGRAATTLSPEQVSLLESDALVMGLYGIDEQQLRSDAVFAGLSVVEQGGLIPLPELSRANAAMTFGSVLSLPIALEEMVPRLLAATDGDLSTEVDPAEPLNAAE